ncbi:hypothetical protein ASC65_12050 [Brevundimonas sp. Root1279]|nr:hypothetical protein ASC65_12050 [Brevundimonas sp. Root1279]
MRNQDHAPVAQDEGQDGDLSRLSLEELSQVPVTSVSRRPEALADAAAAIYVISRDDIRRSGATSLPEVLRLAPNLNVQRVNSVDYAITARGFNGFETANKLLVLIDGRSVYSTLSSGVFWDAQDVMLEDVERIEVISGPGGALYGSNAMNGVINIITRSAADTTGGLVTVGAGNEDATFALRHGGTLGETAAWRAWLTGFMRDESFTLSGDDATDPAEGFRGGGRLDWVAGENLLTLQGEAYDNQGTINEDFSGTQTRVAGGNVLSRWIRPLAGGELEVQAYLDWYERDEVDSIESTRTWDLSAQQAFEWGRHQFVVGAGHREIDSKFTAAPDSPFLVPADRTLTLTNLYVQDQIALDHGLTLTIGAKIEDNSFSGQEFLPNVRLAWRRAGGDLLWGAISQASRTPNRIERDLTLPGFLTGADFQSEEVIAYELGYRANPTPRISFSINTFYNVYNELRTVSPDPATFLPLRLTNFGEAEIWGVEAWGNYDVSNAWRVSAGFSSLDKEFDDNVTSRDLSGLVSIGDDPEYQLTLRSQNDLTDTLDLDVRLRAVDKLTSSDTDGYVEADVRLGWRVTDKLELSVTGQNLIEDLRVETGDPLRRRAFGRSLFLALRASY